MNRVLFLIVISFLYVSSAQSQCIGINVGGGQCVPPDAPGMPGYQADTPRRSVQPAPKWADRWGAIVIDSGTGDAGTAANLPSKEEAVAASMRDCASAGSRNCQTEMVYRNQCAAVAWGQTGHDTARAPTESLARADAMKFCNQKSSSCKIFYSGCSLPERVQ
jgi:hypothetical protein